MPPKTLSKPVEEAISDVEDDMFCSKMAGDSMALSGAKADKKASVSAEKCHTKPEVLTENTPLSPAEELKLKRLEYLKRAREKAKEMTEVRKKERESLVGKTKKQRELMSQLRKEQIALKQALIEKQQARIEKMKQAVKLYDEIDAEGGEGEVDDDEPVKAVRPKAVKAKPVPKPKKKKIVYVSESEDDDEEESEEEEVIVKRKPKAVVKAKPKVVLEDPVRSLTKNQIQDDLRRIQMEMLSKSLFGA